MSVDLTRAQVSWGKGKPRHQGDSLATNAFKISCLYRVVILNNPVRQGSKTLVGLFYESVRRTKVMQRRLAKMAALTSTKSQWATSGEPCGRLATRDPLAPRQASGFLDLKVKIFPFVLRR